MRNRLIVVGILLLFLVNCNGNDGTGRINLVVTDVGTSASAIAPNEALPVSVTIQNQGNQTASSYELTLVLSSDSTYDQSDYLLANVTITGPLPAGTSTTIDDSYVVPGAIANGDFYLIAEVSYLAISTDSNSTTSSTVAALTVSVIEDGLTDTEFAENFADQAVASWLGVEYTPGGRDAITGIDGAGTVLVTLQQLNYAVPDTNADGLYNNQDGTSQAFGFTQAGFVAEARTAGSGFSSDDLSAMQKGDLIFLDYDLDDIWDHAAIYLGDDGTHTHAVLTASDYHDEGVIADLDDDNDALTQDLVWSQAVVKRLDHTAIAAVYSAP